MDTAQKASANPHPHADDTLTPETTAILAKASLAIAKIISHPQVMANYSSRKIVLASLTKRNNLFNGNVKRFRELDSQGMTRIDQLKSGSGLKNATPNYRQNQDAWDSSRKALVSTLVLNGMEAELAEKIATTMETATMVIGIIASDKGQEWKPADEPIADLMAIDLDGLDLDI